MSEFDKSVYNEHYYNTSFGGIPYNRNAHEGHWIKFFSQIANYLKQNYALSRTLDVGCAKGFLVEALRDLEVNAYGFDISSTAHEEIREDIKPYCYIGSIEDPKLYKDSYDMIFCIEVLEHVTEEMALNTIELMCKHTDQILFSSSPSDFEEPTHINVQQPEYWDELFARFGFMRAHEDWPSQIIAPHTVMYRRKSLELILQHQQQKNADVVAKVIESNTQIHNQTLEKLEALTSINQQIDVLRNENLSLKDEVNQHLQKDYKHAQEKVVISSEINALKEEKNHLTNTISSLHIRNHSLADEINRIKNGKTFRLMNKYWKIRDRALPLGSRRRELVKSVARLRKMQAPPIVAAGQTSEQLQQYETNLWQQAFEQWLHKTTDLTSEDWDKQRQDSKKLTYQPLISVLLPVYKIPVEVFKETINSVLNQTYENWELCIALADLTQLDVVNYVKEIEKKYSQIKVNYLEQNGGISLNTNACLEMAEGDFIALLDHDDLITSNALYTMVYYINNEENADFLYSDKDQVNETGESRLNPLFKHKWSWPTMLSANYPTHFCLIRRSLFDRIGLFDKTTDGAQDWDIFLKVSEQARSIVHVPEVLYHWRIIATSVASGLQAKPYVVEAQNKALANYVSRRGFDCELIRNDDHSFYMNWNNTKNVEYDLIIYSDQNQSETEVLATLDSIMKQVHLPSKIIIASAVPFKSYLDKYKQILPVELLVLTSDLNQYLMEVSKTNSRVVAFIKAGITIHSEQAIPDLIGWTEFGNYAAASGKVIDSTKHVVNAGYVMSQDNELIEPYKGMLDYAYTTYGSVNWYREYLAVSEYAIVFKTSVLQQCVKNLPSQESMEQTLLSCQFEITGVMGEAILYDPHAIFNLENEQLSRKTLNVNSKIKDLYFNKSVWDWNPNYLRNHYIPEVSNKEAKSSSSIWDGYTSDAMVLATLYDFTESDLQKNKELLSSSHNLNDVKTAVWFLPPFSTAFYGGIYTIFRFADYMRKNYNVDSKFVIVGTEDIAPVKQAIVDAFPIFKDAEVFSLVNDTKLSSIPDSDIAFCTLWTTAYSLLKYNRTKQKFYFLQDWEPLFYPAGSTSAQTEATFRFGFKAICNTQALEISYKELGGEAISFTPSVDTTVFHPRDGERSEEPYLVFLYGRPGNPRNCFELAIPALRKVKEHFGNKVRILSAGAEWDPAMYGAEGVIEHMGMLPYEATGDLYRQCHVGLAMMMTRHPSYLPFEMMACGCLVVANHNSWNDWMLKDNENCRVTEPSISCISKTIIDSLENKQERLRITNNASTYITNERSNWNGEFDKLFAKLDLFAKV